MAESTGFTGECRDENFTVICDLSRVGGVGRDAGYVSGCVRRCRTTQRRDIERQEKLERPLCLGSSVSIGNTGRLPCINTVVKGKTVDTSSRGKRDVVGPSGLFVRIGVADHMVGVEGLSA